MAISFLATGLGVRRYVFSHICNDFLSFLSLQDIIAENSSTHGAMFCPIILGSDKTTVSVATGNTEYYPLYMSLGPVYNSVRRAHRNAVMLVAFLAIPKGKFNYPLSSS